MKAIWLLALFFFGLRLVGFSQYPPPKNNSKLLHFQHLSQKDGITQGFISSIAQDKFGFMWFATKDGLNRYDGHGFTVFRHIPEDPNSIADNYVQSLYVDRQQRFWVGTSSAGLDLFDPEKEAFMHIKPESGKKGTLQGGQIVDMVMDHQNRLWLNTGLGVFWAWIPKDFPQKPSRLVFHQVNRTLSSIFLDSKNQMWISDKDHKDFVLRPKGQDFEVDSIPNEGASIPGAENRMAIFEDVEEQKIYVWHRNMALMYDHKNKKFKRIPLHSGLPAVENYFDFEGKNGLGWLNIGNKLYQFDLRKNTLTRCYSNLPEDLVSGFSYNKFEDRNGNIWIGSNGIGLFLLNPKTEAFHHGLLDGPENSSVYLIKVSPDGEYFMVNSKLDFWAFDPVSRQFRKANFPRVKDEHLIPRWVLGNLQAGDDPNEMIWINHELNDVFLHYYKPQITYSSPLPKKTALGKDEVWGSKEANLYKFNFRSRKLDFFPLTTKDPKTAMGFIQVLFEDQEGMVWLGTVKGLFKFDPFKNKFTQYRHDPARQNSLNMDQIVSLWPDQKQPDRYLWLGTEGSGFCKFDKQTGVCQRFGQKDGLPNGVVYGILTDDQGKVWLSTNSGLSRFDPETKTYTNFAEEDGLQSDEFNHYSYCKTPNGELIFGGIKGFNHFKPAEIIRKSSPPEVYITQLRVANKEVDFKAKQNILGKPIYLTDSISLPYNSNMMTFRFSVLDFSAVKKNQCRYKLDGFNEEWIMTDKSMTATFTNLDPGKYTLLVEGANSDGVWSLKPKKLEINIIPPWYMTWWFRTTMGLGLAILMYFVYRYRLQQAIRLQILRNNIAQDLHDEIGSNLSNISIFSELAITKSGQKKDISHLLEKIQEYAQISQESMGDIVWMVNAKNDRFDNILMKMRALAIEWIEGRGILLHLNFDENLGHLRLEMDQRKNFYLLYKEALNNLLKYAQATEVWINLTYKNGQIQLRIKDNGQGFDLDKTNTGNGLGNMAERAGRLNGECKIVSEPEKGTEVLVWFRV